MDMLLVDDSKTITLLGHRAMRQACYQNLTVCEAENGADALEKLKSVKTKLVLSRWNMHEMSGIDLLRKFWEGEDMTPFGFITSGASKKFKGLPMSNGAGFIIVKPFGGRRSRCPGSDIRRNLAHV